MYYVFLRLDKTSRAILVTSKICLWMGNEKLAQGKYSRFSLESCKNVVVHMLKDDFC